MKSYKATWMTLSEIVEPLSALMEGDPGVDIGVGMEEPTSQSDICGLEGVDGLLWLLDEKFLKMVSRDSALDVLFSAGGTVAAWADKRSNRFVLRLAAIVVSGFALASTSRSLPLPWVLELLFGDRQKRRELQLRVLRRCAARGSRFKFSRFSLTFNSSPALMSVSELLISAETMFSIRANVTCWQCSLIISDLNLNFYNTTN